MIISVIRRHDRFIAGKITLFQVVRYFLYDNWFETAINDYPIIGTYSGNNLTKFWEQPILIDDVMPHNIKVGCVFSDDRFIEGLIK